MRSKALEDALTSKTLSPERDNIFNNRLLIFQIGFFKAKASGKEIADRLSFFPESSEFLFVPLMVRENISHQGHFVR
jgi:hypothetical protein